MPSTKVHTVLPAGHPDRPASLFDEVPLFCGQAKRWDTRTSHFAHQITCAKCKRLNDRYVEDLDYRRTQQKLSDLRSLEAHQLG